MTCSKTTKKVCIGLILIFFAVIASACSKESTLRESAYVVPEKMKLRSSVAQAARAVGELKSGDPVTITDKEDSEDGTPWVKVKGPDGVTGWAEQRYFVRDEIVSESRKIADKIKDIQTQAVGKSKASLKLRLTPDRVNEENVASTLPSGTMMEIVARDRKPKPTAVTGSESETEAAASAGEVKYDDWYLVRLRDFTVLPAGWIYGGSVGLEIPPEVVYFVSNGRRISGWLKIGTVHGDDGTSGEHYLILERKIFGVDEQMDFDRIKILAYDPSTRNYSTPFREDVSGKFPVRLEMQGTSGKFELNAIDKNNQSVRHTFFIQMLENGKIKVDKPGKK